MHTYNNNTLLQYKISDICTRKYIHACKLVNIARLPKLGPCKSDGEKNKIGPKIGRKARLPSSTEILYSSFHFFIALLAL